MSTYRIDRHGENVTWMNGKELKALQLVWSLLGTMEKSSGQALEGRLRRAGAWRMWRLATAWLRRALAQMVRETVCLEQQQMCEHVINHGSIDITVRAGVSEDQVVVPAQALKLLADAAIGYHCVMCFKEGKEVRRCPLRRALLRACVPDSLEDVSGCVYRDLVLGSEKPGEYVEI